MIGLQYYGTHICVPFILEDTIYDNAVPIVQEFASRLFKSLAMTSETLSFCSDSLHLGAGLRV